MQTKAPFAVNVANAECDAKKNSPCDHSSGGPAPKSLNEKGDPYTMRFMTDENRRNTISETLLMKVERLAKIFSYVGVPVLLFIIQGELAKNSASREHMNLAVSLLREPISTEPERQLLRAWAIDLFAETSPVHVSDEMKRALMGKVGLPLAGPCFPSVDGDVNATPMTAEVGAPITFLARGRGGNGEYVFMWAGPDGLHGDDSQLQASFPTPGEKEVTVRITSNGEFAFKTVKVLVTERRN